MSPRKLSTAEDRREDVLLAAQSVFAERGIHGTPTAAVAKEAGISQAYLFRLFPTKVDLAVALVGRCNERILGAFEAAAAQAHAAGHDPLEAMGEAYVELLQDRQLLLLQLHAHAACASMPEVREAMRDGFGRIVAFVQDTVDGDAEKTRSFMATGMLINVLAAMDAPAVDAPWAGVLMAKQEC